ncbi:hypothetical protein IGI04_002802, partial [Brassica rapa subsp. trilocularis]
REVREAISLSFFSPPKPLLLGPSPLIPSGGRRWVYSRRSTTPNRPADLIHLPVMLRAFHFLLAPPSLVLAGLWPDPVTKLMTGCVSSVSGERARLWQSGLSCAGSGSVPAQRLTGLKRVAASSLPVFSLLCSPLSPASVATLRASPSCSHGPRRSDETEDLAVLEPVVPPMLDRFVGRGPPPAELRGVSQALPLMPARSHFGEFSTELSLAILLFHL